MVAYLTTERSGAMSVKFSSTHSLRKKNANSVHNSRVYPDKALNCETQAIFTVLMFAAKRTIDQSMPLNLDSESYCTVNQIIVLIYSTSGIT